MIRFEQVTKRFDVKQRPALQDVSLEIAAGTITGVVGPDGSGKTTFLRLAAGLLLPTEGRVIVFGQDTRQSVEFREHLAYMPQKFGLYDSH